MMDFGVMGGLGWAGMLFAVFFWVALIVLALGAVRGIFSGPRAVVAPSAQEILRGRYARGEITEAEYEQARQSLGLA